MSHSPLSISIVLSLMLGVALGCGWNDASASTSAGKAGAASSSGSGGAADSCYNYGDFDGTMPIVSFTADVLPILRRSCGISTSCHGSVTHTAKGQHYYGPKLKNMDGTPRSPTI